MTTFSLVLILLVAIAVPTLLYWIVSKKPRKSKLCFLGKILFVVALIPSFSLLLCAIISHEIEATRAKELARQEREARAQIEETLNEVVRLVSENDFDAALNYVSEKALQTREHIERNRHEIRVKEARATDFRIESLDLDLRPPCAVVSFHASIRGTASVWPIPQRLPYLVESDVLHLELRREDDGIWRVQDRYMIVHSNPNAK